MGKKPRSQAQNEAQFDLFAQDSVAVAAAPPPERPGPAPTREIVPPEGLLEWLRRGHGQRLTVLTPNLRLAQALEAQVDAAQVAAGQALWDAPDILAFPSFLRRCHEEAAYSARGAALPALLSESAALLLWEEAIRASRWRESLLSVPAAASLAAEAWSLAHAWRIEGALQGEEGSEDAEAFAAWSESYARRTQRENLTDAARLPHVLAPLLGQGGIGLPATLVLYAFDRLTPQQADFLDACMRAGIEVLHCEPAATKAQVMRILAATPREELEQAARWARARLEACATNDRAPRIAVVVPDLASRRSEVARVFARVLSHPRRPPGDTSVPLFNLSLGEPLSAYPLVDAALAIIEVAAGAVPYDRASRLLRSAFIAGALAEESDRARLDAALRRTAPAALTLPRLCALLSHASRGRGAPPCPRLAALLDALVAGSRGSARAPPCEWARRFSVALESAGFPGERPLDSHEYQAFLKWGEVLGELAALTPVAGEWNASEARSRLRRLCADTVFQPRSGTAPVQVLGLLESVGLRFEHLWVSGLTESAWPIPARPHPLLAPALQRRAGIPQASAESAFAVDQQITRDWQHAAPEVVFSSARAEGDRELLASPLIAHVPVSAAAVLAVGEYAGLGRMLFRARKRALSAKQDDVGPPLAGAAAQGGTGIVVDQAACPFRAFAHYRLDARALESPAPGLGPMERGTLLHSMMAKLWESLQDSATLHATDEATLGALIDAAVVHALEGVREARPGRLEERFAELERERLAAIAREWLGLELRRTPFTVLVREEKYHLTAGNLQIEGRVDRIDRLEGGGLAVIDYKSGNVNVASWMGERPDDAQLPLYALAASEEDVRAVVYARLKTGDRGFSGVAREADLIPGARTVDKTPSAKPNVTWEELIASWRREVDQLGENFASGDARVDPKALLSTCRWCDLKPLCRVHERLTPLDEGDEDESAEEES